MNVYLILPLLCMSIYLVSAQKTDLLDALNKGQRSTIAKNDSLSAEDRERQRKIREEFLRDQEFKSQLIREDTLQREQQQKDQQKQEQRADTGTAGAGNAIAGAPAPQSSFPSQGPVHHQAFGQQVPYQQAAPAQQQGSIDPLKILSSGIFGDLLAPKILGQTEAASQLIPKLVTPNLLQNLPGGQQGQKAGSAGAQPGFAGAAQPFNYGGVPAVQPGVYNPYGNALSMQQPFAGFGQQAMPNFGFPQTGGYPAASFVQPSQLGGMSPMLGGSYLPQQPFTG